MNFLFFIVVIGDFFLLRVKFEIIFFLGNVFGEIVSIFGVCSLIR